MVGGWKGSSRTSARKCLKETVSQSGPTVHGGGDWEGLEVGAQREQAWLGWRGACTVPRERDR